jgi:plasmid stability protein
MVSITVRRFSGGTDAELRALASGRGRSPEAYLRRLLAQAVSAAGSWRQSRCPHDLIAPLEPEQDIAPLIAEQGEKQAPVDS